MKKIRLYSLVFLLSFALSLQSCSDENTEEELDFRPTYEFAIMIVPDIQNYTHLNERLKYLDAIVDCYKNNRSKISAILQVGDLTNNNQTWQYENANDHFMSKFNDDDNLYFCLGNHDYGNNGISDIRNSNIPSNMMSNYDIAMEGHLHDNRISYVKMGKDTYGVMMLEFAIREKTIEWANSVLSNDPQTPYIILTHAFLNNKGQMYDRTIPETLGNDSPTFYRMGEDYKNDSKEVFDKLIYHNPNVKLVICGHSLTPDYINVLTKENVVGNQIHMIMVNYQHYKNGGDGTVAILEKSCSSYKIRSYNAFHKKFGSKHIEFGI